MTGTGQDEDMNNWNVYRHSSPSGKVYIGISSNVKDRWANSGYNYKRYDSIFKKAIEKYGWENLQHEILLENCSKAEADYAERYLIRWYKIHGLSYNITDGGDGKAGVKYSDGTKEKIRQSNLGQRRTPEQRENISKAHYTETALASSRKNINYAHNAWKGCHHSEETKRRMSEGAKGRNMSKAQEAKMAKKRQNAIPIIVTKNGEFVGEYKLLSDICKDLSLDAANATRSLLKGYKVKGYCLTYKM